MVVLFLKTFCGDPCGDSLKPQGTGLGRKKSPKRGSRTRTGRGKFGGAGMGRAWFGHAGWMSLTVGCPMNNPLASRSYVRREGGVEVPHCLVKKPYNSIYIMRPPSPLQSS